MTKRDLELIKQRFPLSAAVIKRNADAGDSGLRAADTKPDEGKPLVRRLPRKGASGPRAFGRARIRFTVFSVRPADWDAYSVKELQDLLIRATIIHGDEWDVLQGEVVSEKVHSKAEEKTVIEITPLADQA